MRLSAQLQVRQGRLPAARRSGEDGGRLGRHPAGDPLPSIRPLAEELRVNRNTVAKAYTELESQGVIETIAGKGCFVRGQPLAVQERSAPQAAGRDDRRRRGARASPANRQGGVPAACRGTLRRASRTSATRADRDVMTAMTRSSLRHRDRQPGPPLRPHRCRGRTEPPGAAGTLLRLFRPQRRRQDHDDQVPAEPAPPDAAASVASSAWIRRATRSPSSRGSPTCRTTSPSIPG